MKNVFFREYDFFIVLFNRQQLIFNTYLLKITGNQFKKILVLQNVS